MVSFGTQGFGLSGAAERIDTNKKSPFSRVDYFFKNLSLNYAYRVSPKVQFGLFFQNIHQEYKFIKEGDGERTSTDTNIFGLLGLYNFSDDLQNTYFTGMSIAKYNVEEENSHDLGISENKAPFELDDTGFNFELLFGKRWDLNRWKIERLSFAPQMGLYYRTHGKDFDDQYAGNGVGVALHLIKFDLLF